MGSASFLKRPLVAGAALAVLMALHLFLAVDAARRLSPAWDEIAYPVAGAVQWRTGAILLNPEHGPISKLLMSLPLVAKGVPVPPLTLGDQYGLGFLYLFQNREPATSLVFWSRWSSIFFSTATLLLLCLWRKRTAGWGAGLVTAACFAATPIFRARSSLALLEMPMYFFMTAALFSYSVWQDRDDRSVLWMAGAATGLALGCKFAALPLLPALLLAEALRRRGWRVSLSACLTLVAAAGLTVVAVYVPWQRGSDAFAAAVRNIFGFSRVLPYYWAGRSITAAPSYLSAAAFVIKAPPAILLAGSWGAWRGWRRGASAERLVLLWIVITAAFILASATPVTTVQGSPIYLGLAFLAGSVAHEKGKRLWVALLLIGAALIETVAIHPRYLSYFNVLVGGNRQGFRWLADSDQDWGQALPALAEDLRTREPGALLLAYSGAADPRAYGIRYQDVYSPALVSRHYRGESLLPSQGPVVFALSTKVWQTEKPALYGVLRGRQPARLVGDCFLVFDFTHDAAAFDALAQFYAQTGRPVLAEGARRQAALLRRDVK